MTEQTTSDTVEEDITVTVVTPFCEKYTPSEMLNEAIDSVRSQTGVETECIVIEDEEERGPAWARNVGLDRADTRYVAFLDADDIWRETKLSEQLREMEATGAGMCVDGDVEYDPIEFAGALLTGETFGLTSSILIDTEQTDVRFDESLERREDHMYMIQVAAEAGICFSQDTFVARKFEEGLSTQVDTTPEQMAEFFDTLVERVPAVKQFEDEYYQNSFIYLGRLRHGDGEYWTAIRYFIESIKYGPNVLAFGALAITVVWGTFDYLTQPARRILGRGVHD